MTRRLFLLVVLSSISLLSYAQNSADTISIVKNRYLLQGQMLKFKQLLDLMKEYPDTYIEMKKAKSNYDASMVFGAIGGFCVGSFLGGLIAGGEPNWAMAGVGVGAVVLSIPLGNTYNKRAKDAIRMYNSEIRGLGQSSYAPYERVLSVGVTSSGIGLRYAL